MKTLIIAEAGVNHNGNIDIAKKLIDVAANAKADFVKFQSFKAESLVSKNAKKAKYQIKNMNDDETNQFNMLKNLELTKSNHIELIKYCNKKGIKFLSTAFDKEGLLFLNKLGLELFKVPSGEITNFPYLYELSKLNKPVVLSTGMSKMSEIKDAINIILSNGLSKKKLKILHCNTDYPTPMKDVNLKAMLTIKNKFDIDVGYSDHTIGIEVAIAAVAMGAKIIEKHFTLDKKMDGPDHLASIEPDELSLMVKSIRNIEYALSGSGLKVPSAGEKSNLKIVRKSIYLKKSKKKGHVISESDIIPLRPFDGISAMQWNDVIGKKLLVDLDINESLKWNHISKEKFV